LPRSNSFARRLVSAGTLGAPDAPIGLDGDVTLQAFNADGRVVVGSNEKSVVEAAAERSILLHYYPWDR
jgi:hypothetical protein